MEVKKQLKRLKNNIYHYKWNSGSFAAIFFVLQNDEVEIDLH